VPHNSLTAFACQFWLRAPLVIINNNPWIITYEWAAIVCECVKAKTKGQQQQFVDCVWSAVASNLSLGPKSIEVPLPGCRLRCLCTCADLTPKEITTQIETQPDTRYSAKNSNSSPGNEGNQLNLSLHLSRTPSGIGLSLISSRFLFIFFAAFQKLLLPVPFVCGLGSNTIKIKRKIINACVKC